MIVFAAIMPHPPESVPGIGKKGNSRTIKKTLKAFDQLRTGLEKADPDVVVVISPHAHLEQYFFVINSARKLAGSFEQFGIKKSFTFNNDLQIADELFSACFIREFPAELRKNPLDYGALIPLYHLLKRIKPKIVHLTFSFMDYDFHYRYGQILQKIIDDNTQKRVAVIASGDLSHKLSLESPVGFSPKAKEFDQLMIRYLKEINIKCIMELKQPLVSEVAECGIRSFMILFGALHGKEYKFKLLSYESPMGIGYLTARLI